MGFWNYLGLAILAKYLFGRRKRQSTDHVAHTHYYDDNYEDEMYSDCQNGADLDDIETDME